MSRRLVSRGLWLALVMLLLASACSSSSEESAESADVSVFGPWRGATADSFREVLTTFEERSGITVTYTGTSSFADEITGRVTTADFPDVAIFPQPGLLLSLLNDGHVVPMPIDLEAMVQNGYAPKIGEAVGWLTGGAGIVYRLNVKSLVWYPPLVFESEGYAIPRTWDELEALAERMVDDGYAPWCLGVEAFGASGWPATDWVEDLVLRLYGPEVYDEWLWGDVRFTDPRIAAAFATFDRTTLFDRSTVGGRRDVLNTSAERAHDPMFDDPARCLMHRQASFAEDWLPEDVDFGTDVDVFSLPGMTDATPPLLIGGNFVGALRDADAVWELIAFLASPDGYFGGDGTISPNADALAQQASDPLVARLADALNAANVVRFDGSDVMYPGVGTGSFLDAMLEYIATSNLESSLDTAQSGWDAIESASSGPEG